MAVRLSALGFELIFGATIAEFNKVGLVTRIVVHGPKIRKRLIHGNKITPASIKASKDVLIRNEWPPC
jgi:hypothetical protein